MKKFRLSLAMILMATVIFAGCSSMNKTQKGAVAGTAAGGAMGAVIGKASGNTAMGAIIGAAVGGTAGPLLATKWTNRLKKLQKTFLMPRFFALAKVSW
jgi:hypothetical protein